jgi:hypothetical protein
VSEGAGNDDEAETNREAENDEKAGTIESDAGGVEAES